MLGKSLLDTRIFCKYHMMDEGLIKRYVKYKAEEKKEEQQNLNYSPF